MTDTTAKAGWRMTFASFALVLALFVPVWFIAAALGSKFGLWGWQFGLGKMTFQWGPMLAIAAVVVAVLAIIIGLIKAPRTKPVILGLFALLIAGLGLGRLIGTGAVVEALPPIHDIQTDWSDPIQFSDELMALRGEGSNPVVDDPIIPEGANGRWPGTGGTKVSAAQAKGYPDLRSLILAAPADVTYAAAFNTADELGWQIVTNDEENYRLEATYTSGWYGFKDDIAVRIRPSGEGSEIDVRSTSRVGLSDLGANAARIESFLNEVQAKLATGSAE